MMYWAKDTGNVNVFQVENMSGWIHMAILYVNCIGERCKYKCKYDC